MSFRKLINLLYYIKQERIDKVTKTYIDDEFDDVIKCVRVLNLNRKILAKRISDENSKSTRRTFNQRLNEIQENAIINYIRRLNDTYISSNSKLIVDAVNYIIQKVDDLASFVNQH